jgi:hypothetical protein
VHVRRGGAGLAASFAGLGLLADDGHGYLTNKSPVQAVQDLLPSRDISWRVINQSISRFMRLRSRENGGDSRARVMAIRHPTKTAFEVRTSDAGVEASSRRRLAASPSIVMHSFGLDSAQE